MKMKPIPGVCRWCGEAVLHPETKEPGKLTWHDACVVEYKRIFWPAETRKAVLARDRGICAVCGIDTLRVESRLERCSGFNIAPDWCRWALVRGWEGPHWGKAYRAAEEAAQLRYNRMCVRYSERQPILKAAAQKRLNHYLSMGFRKRVATWNADHITALVNADSADLSYWKLDNLQTLCHPCHVKKSGRDVREKNRRKKGIVPQPELAL